MRAPEHSDENVVLGRFGAARADGNRQPETEASDGPSASADYLKAASWFGYRPLPSQFEELADAYWDTASFDILRSGSFLRLRGTREGLRVTVRSLDRPGFDDLERQRFEVAGAVADVTRPLDPSAWPEAVRERVRAAAGETPSLLPICVLHLRRERIPLARDEQADPTVAVLNLDRVAIFDPHGMAADASLRGVSRLLEDQAPIASFTEVELERRTETTPSFLRELAQRLCAVPDLAPVAGSKLEHALREMTDHPADAPPGKVGISSRMSMAEAGRLIWRRQLVAMLLNEAGVRRGEDREYVHDMRVATRRAREVASLFGPFFRRRALKDHLKSLRRTARALGAVRDADVALFNLKKYARTRPDADQNGLSEIRAVWRVERRRAVRRLLEWLDSPSYRAFVTDFAAFCHEPGLGVRTKASALESEHEPSRIGDVLPSAIMVRFEQIRAYEPLFESGKSPSVPALHRLRADCKALRYSLEPVEHLLGDEGGELIRQLKRLQDLLGDLHDTAVVDDRLAELGDAVDAEALSSYRAQLKTTLAELVAAAPAAWQAFVAPENRQRLALAIARL